MVSLSTKSKTFPLYSSGRETQSFWFNLSNMVDVEIPDLLLLCLETFWAIAQLGFAHNNEIATNQQDRFLIEFKDIIKNLPIWQPLNLAAFESFQFISRRVFLLWTPSPCMVNVHRGMRRRGILRRDHHLTCAYLWATAVPTCLHIPMQLNMACFLFREWRYRFPRPCTVSPGSSFAVGQGCERR